MSGLFTPRRNSDIEALYALTCAGSVSMTFCLSFIPILVVGCSGDIFRQIIMNIREFLVKYTRHNRCVLQWSFE